MSCWIIIFWPNSNLCSWSELAVSFNYSRHWKNVSRLWLPARWKFVEDRLGEEVTLFTPSFPHLMLLNVFFWIYLKDEVYLGKPATNEKLKTVTEIEWAQILNGRFHTACNSLKPFRVWNRVIDNHNLRVFLFYLNYNCVNQLKGPNKYFIFMSKQFN